MSNNNGVEDEEAIDIEDLQQVISKTEDREILSQIDTLSLNTVQKQKELEIINSCLKREDLDEYRKAREDSVLKANQMNNFSNYTAHAHSHNKNNSTPLNLSQSNSSTTQNENNQNQNVNTANGVNEVTWGSERNHTDMNIGSLLRFLKSDFDCWVGVSSLYKYPSPGVHDYLCNALYSMPDEEIEFYLVQFCTMLVFIEFSSNALERFIMDKCKKSIHFALLVLWFLQSLAVDAVKIEKCENLQAQCEIAVVNSTQQQMGKLLSSSMNLNHSTESASTLSQMINNNNNFNYNFNNNNFNNNNFPNQNKYNEDIEESLDKYVDFSTLSAPLLDDNNLPLISNPNNINNNINNNNNNLKEGTEGNESGSLSSSSSSSSSSLPISLSSSHEEDPMINEALRKKERCDYFNQILDFVVELGKISDKLRMVPIPERGQKLRADIAAINRRMPVGLYLPLWDASNLHYCIVRIVPEESKVLNSRERVPYIIVFETLESNSKSSTQDLQEVASSYIEVIREASSLLNDVDVNDPDRCNSLLSLQESYKHSPFGIPFEIKKISIRSKSPLGKFESWDLKSIIVKYGDDCRQEYLAMQLISQFKKIFDHANLPLYLRPYRILVNSVSSGLIETITDSVSLHQLKRFYLPENITIQHHFQRFYGKDTENYKSAVKNFVNSLAAYSLLTYILQVKDRHNGNIMITSEGHIIHIDFGFMLSNSPGALNAENVPFKFTQEFLDVMGGLHSPMFKYFRDLFYRGYLELRKNYEKIVLLVEMMAIGSKLPCFYAGRDTITALKERFMLNLSDRALSSFVDNLLFQSYNNWRTHFYDRYQYLTNGILI